MKYNEEIIAVINNIPKFTFTKKRKLTKDIDVVFSSNTTKSIIYSYHFSLSAYTTEKVIDWLKSKSIKSIEILQPASVRFDFIDHSAKAFNKQMLVKRIRDKREKTKRRRKVYIPKYPKMLEAQYIKLASSYVDKMQAITERLFSRYLPGIVDSAGFRQDSWNDNVKDVIDALKISFDKELPNFSIYAEDIGQKSSSWHNKEWQKTMKSISEINFYQNEPWLVDVMKSFVSQNTNLITKLTDETLQNVNGIIDRGIIAGKRHETLMKEILNGTELQKGVFKTVRTRARLIARDQVAKLNGNLMRLRQTNLGITHYFWRTSLDERVRSSHEELEGQRFSWKNPPSVGHPGEDYQCRCTAEPDFEGLLDTGEND